MKLYEKGRNYTRFGRYEKNMNLYTLVANTGDFSRINVLVVQGISY